MPERGNPIPYLCRNVAADPMFMLEHGNPIQVSYAGTWQPIPYLCRNVAIRSKLVCRNVAVDPMFMLEHGNPIQVSVSDRDTRPFNKPQSQCIFSQSYNKR
uniref:Uncharacterized protein n=1 Tax=Solanum tuberosum TaxID=4113 RepID=M1DDP3_SOLTU